MEEEIKEYEKYFSMKFVRHKIGELCHNVTDGEHGTVSENGDFYLLSNKI